MDGGLQPICRCWTDSALREVGYYFGKSNETALVRFQELAADAGRCVRTLALPAEVMPEKPQWDGDPERFWIRVLYWTARSDRHPLLRAIRRTNAGPLSLPLDDLPALRQKDPRSTFVAFAASRTPDPPTCWYSILHPGLFRASVLVIDAIESMYASSSDDDRPAHETRSVGQAIADGLSPEDRARFAARTIPKDLAERMRAAAQATADAVAEWNKPPKLPAIEALRVAEHQDLRKRKRRRRKSPISIQQRALTLLEVTTLEVVGAHKRNFAAAARELGRNAKTVRENYMRALRKMTKATGDSRSVAAKSLPTDRRGNPNVKARGG
jgi:hypothetical protein